MSLEEDRNTRDYLFGRLLAIAEHIEERALHLAKEGRETNAARLMQRFADRPASTWRTIELALTPYKARLRANRPGVLLTLEKQLDGVMCQFQASGFTDDEKLSGEFLLGYHCQRAALWADASKDRTTEENPLQEGER
jgi:CRISPR-associated protein Csd1